MGVFFQSILIVGVGSRRGSGGRFLGVDVKGEMVGRR